MRSQFARRDRPVRYMLKMIMEFINLHGTQSKMIENIDNHMVGGSIVDPKILGLRLC